MKTIAIVAATLAAMQLLAGTRRATAQSSLGAVVCVGSELETVPSSNPVRRVFRTDAEVMYRVGVELANRDVVEGNLRSQLGGYTEGWCAWSDPGDSHVIIIRYTGAIRIDLTLDPEDPRFQAFGVGYGTSWEEAEQFATRLDDRFVSYNDGSGYEVLVRETWAAGGGREAVGRDAPAPGAAGVKEPVVREPAVSGEPAPGGPAAAGFEPGYVFRDCSACPQMVVVPPGSFTMGSPASEVGRDSDEGPQLMRLTGGFAIGVDEVTFAEWDACVRAGGCGGHSPDDEGWGRGRRPVMEVSWEDARAYARWLSGETAERYRLPSEAEWEYAARAGTRTARYWGESESGQCGYANGGDSYVACSDGHEYTAPVGSFAPNAFGLYDVLGNVSEWTEDCWNNGYLGAPTDGSAWQAGDCSGRVLRGGSWSNGPWNLRSASRHGILAGSRGYSGGFRVARTIN